MDENVDKIRYNEWLIRRLKVSQLLDCFCAGLCVGFAIGALINPLAIIPLVISIVMWIAALAWGNHLLTLGYQEEDCDG